MKISSWLTLIFVLFTQPILAQWTNGQNAEYVVGQSNFTTKVGGASSTSFNLPYDVALDLTNNKMYVVDLVNHRVLRFGYPITSNQPTAELVFGQADMISNKPNRNGTAQANTLFFPTAVVVRNGILWICDQANHRILRFNNAAALTTNGPNADLVLGQADFVTATSGTAANKLNAPYDITFDSDGNLWVAEMQNNRVLRFNNAESKNNGANADGVLGQTSFTTSTSATTQSTMNMPTGVVFYKNYLFVVDLGNNRVLRFNNAASKANGAIADGVLGQANFTSNGDNRGGTRGQNTMSMPFKAETDASSRLYVSDQGNNRILIFNYAHLAINGSNASGVLGQTNFTSGTAGVTQNIVDFANGSAIDFTGNKLIVADEQNNRVLQFSASSELIFLDPESVVYDPTSKRYLISNTGNGTIVAKNENGVLSYFNEGGSTSLRGLTIYDNKLYAAGDEGVNIYDLNNGQKLSSVNLPGKVFPNDIESDGNGNIYISDDGAHKIFKLVTSTQNATVFVDMGAESPNGLFFDKTNNRLIVVFSINNSPIKAIDLNSGVVSLVRSTNLNLLDGIASDSQGNYYISSWGTGTVYKFDNSFINDPIVFSSGHSGPADIYCNKQNNILAIPDMILNKLNLIQLAGISLIAPNGGEVWRIGTTHNIQWNSSGIANVKIEYSTNNGTSWLQIISSAAAANGTYSWIVPNTPSSNCLVRITDVSNASNSDQSNSIFTIEPGPNITVNSPNGGEVWRVGTTQNIQWTSSGVTNVKIEYSTNNGTNWLGIISSINAANGIYGWVIPNTPSPNCLVRISDVSDVNISDRSNSLFGIDPIPTVTVNVPNGGEVWDIGSSHNIQWICNNITNVKLEYSTNNGTNWIEIIASTPAASNSYSWTIPNTASANCLVRISSQNEATIKDQSNAVFTIQVPVSVNENILPQEFYLSQNYPNPFNPTTTIKYGIPQKIGELNSNGVRVTLKIFDILGKIIATIVDENKSTGFYSIQFSTDQFNLTSGVYYYKLTAGSYSQVKKMIILR